MYLQQQPPKHMYLNQVQLQRQIQSHPRTLTNLPRPLRPHLQSQSHHPHRKPTNTQLQQKAQPTQPTNNHPIRQTQRHNTQSPSHQHPEISRHKQTLQPSTKTTNQFRPRHTSHNQRPLLPLIHPPTRQTKQNLKRNANQLNPR